MFCRVSKAFVCSFCQKGFARRCVKERVLGLEGEELTLDAEGTF